MSLKWPKYDLGDVVKFKLIAYSPENTKHVLTGTGIIVETRVYPGEMLNFGVKTVVVESLDGWAGGGDWLLKKTRWMSRHELTKV